MIDHYKKNYFSRNAQFILTDKNGRVIDSDHTFLDIPPGVLMADIHPFFSWLPGDMNATQDPLLFSCVHLELNDFEYITDVEITQEKDGILIMIHNLTEHYAAYQTSSQVKNMFLIKSELAVLKNVQLVEQEKFKNQFIGNLSHELRNPLTSIIAITNVVEKTNLEDHQRQMMQFLKDCTENLKSLLDDILSINKIASGKLQLKKKTFSLKKLLDLLAFTYTTKAVAKQLEFKMTVDKKIPEFVEGDRLRLFQVLTNLLENAVNYSEKGTILFEILLNQKRAGKANIRFSVRDNGIGIPKEKFNAIFESFSRLNATDESKKGNGLGLSIVKGLLELMKSKIRIESSPNMGSVFYFDLLLKYPVLEKPVVPAKTSKKKSQNYKYKGKDGKFRILLVEDDALVQMMLFKILTDTSRFYIDLLDNGSEVLEVLTKNEYDIIVMDVNLQGQYGDKIAKDIRKFPTKHIRKVPIIGVTANAFASDVARYKKAGMNAVIIKPFDPQELLKTIFKYL